MAQISLSFLREAITAAYRRDEREAVNWLLSQYKDDPSCKDAAQSLAQSLVERIREQRATASGVDALMHEFSLSSQEGIALMCLAEALLRIPDRETADKLIADKISKGDWRRHLGESPSLFVNAATWGLLITGKLVSTSSEQGLTTAITRLIAKGGEPLIRKGVDLAMRMLGNQFVAGQTIEEALAHSRGTENRGYRHSYDMLGEAALTAEDAQRYYKAYEQAIHAIGATANGRGIKDGPGISIKLSALHPRYARSQRARVLEELLPRLKKLLLLAKRYNIGLNIDAEEADRLELSLDLIERLALDDEFADFDGLGVVVQAYQKRAPFVIDYLAELARQGRRKLMIRLVKGAYWDTEIKRSQVDGMSGYPVYTRKPYTDVSYLVCAQKLLTLGDCIYPQFATHNAHTLAAIYTWARHQGITDYEFQCLHGMGETLYDQVVGPERLNKACRIYAPVGSHQTLLAYLVRRLLENGANSSFVNQLVDDRISIDALLADPIETARQFNGDPHPVIRLPVDMFGDERRNSMGMDFSNEQVLSELDAALGKFAQCRWSAMPIVGEDVKRDTAAKPVLNPSDHADIVGEVVESNTEQVEAALACALDYADHWQSVPSTARADMLCRAADLLEQRRYEFMALAAREAGKSLPNATGEVREAVDFLRYYAAQIRNADDSAALGPVVCISPWNFPLSIFIGQISAALAAGNVVLAKPAEQTPLIAHLTVQLLHEAGIPKQALQFLPGTGEEVGARLVADSRTRGVIFTGSTEVAQSINRTLAQRSAKEGNEIPLIAETGGQNAMIVDSSALPEQVVQDTIASAFDSAGQRCSALRVLCLQEDIADKVLHMLKGAMQELRIGNPYLLETDIGPVIDEEAREGLQKHVDQIKKRSLSFFQIPLQHQLKSGTFFPPLVVEIGALSELTREVFGPVLHVLRYRRGELPQLLDAINATGYGLTLGIHSRIDETVEFIASHAHVGNIYVNRNIIGAVVGVQPFGGEGKSGTGPKAGGPLYLKRLRRHSVFKIGNAQLAEQRLPSEFFELLAWASQNGYKQIADLGQQYADLSLCGQVLKCTGPTGESNELRFFPRGTVWCAASDTAVLLNQLLAVFATGNDAVIGNLDKTAFLPLSIRSRLYPLGKDKIGLQAISVALADGTTIEEVRSTLAARDGALVPLFETYADQLIPVWRLIAERALCVNVAAAGGNAGLMTLSV